MSRTAALLVASVLGAGCNGPGLPTASAPTSVDPPVPITMTILAPGAQGRLALLLHEVFGTGFTPGIRLTFGGATRACWFHNGILSTMPPWREPGRWWMSR